MHGLGVDETLREVGGVGRQDEFASLVAVAVSIVDTLGVADVFLLDRHQRMNMADPTEGLTWGESGLGHAPTRS